MSDLSETFEGATRDQKLWDIECKLDACRTRRKAAILAARRAVEAEPEWGAEDIERIKETLEMFQRGPRNPVDTLCDPRTGEVIREFKTKEEWQEWAAKETSCKK